MKIAILGSSPSKEAAPFSDPQWAIWTCSPGTVGVPRVDLHFELHRLSVIENDGEMYKDYLRVVPVMMQDHYPQFPHSIQYPKDTILAEFGPHFFTSSVSYMLAWAIFQKPSAIGLWGVDMEADEEYGHQREGCLRFLEIAKQRRIELVIPNNSGLLKPSKLYGYE